MPFEPGHKLSQGSKKKKVFPWTFKHIEECFEKCLKIIQSGDLPESEQVKATMKMLEFMSNYHYGKPAQSVDLTSGDKPLAAIVNISLSDKPLT